MMMMMIVQKKSQLKVNRYLLYREDLREANELTRLYHRDCRVARRFSLLRLIYHNCNTLLRHGPKPVWIRRKTYIIK